MIKMNTIFLAIMSAFLILTEIYLYCQYVTAVLDSDVLTDGGGAILQSLESMGVQYEVKKLPCDATIGWMRNRVEFVAEENGQV